MNIKDKILEVLNSNDNGDYESSNFKYAAKELEILFLQSHVDLLNSIVTKPHFHENEGVEIYINGLGIENTIEDLNTRIKELSK